MARVMARTAAGRLRHDRCHTCIANEQAAVDHSNEWEQRACPNSHGDDRWLPMPSWQGEPATGQSKQIDSNTGATFAQTKGCQMASHPHHLDCM